MSCSRSVTNNPIELFIPIGTDDKIDIQDYQGAYHVDDLKLQFLCFGKFFYFPKIL